MGSDLSNSPYQGLQDVLTRIPAKLRVDPAFLLVVLRLFQAEKELESLRAAQGISMPKKEVISSGSGRLSSVSERQTGSVPSTVESTVGHDNEYVVRFGSPAPGFSSAPAYKVNPRQYRRIMKRRELRRLFSCGQSTERNGGLKYVYESRHQHALKRPRDGKGRFLTRKEMETNRNGECVIRKKNG